MTRMKNQYQFSLSVRIILMKSSIDESKMINRAKHVREEWIIWYSRKTKTNESEWIQQTQREEWRLEVEQLREQNGENAGEEGAGESDE